MFPLRSLLFVPGNDLKKIKRAFQVGADAVILDLEDAVAVSQKSRARAVVREVLQTTFGCPTYVRVNALTTNLAAADLAAVVTANLTGIMLPKTESAAQVRELDRILTDREQRLGLSVGSIVILPQIESAGGILKAYRIALTSKRIKRLSFGAADYALDTGVMISNGGVELLYPRSQLVLASRAAGAAPPVDTVYTNFRDLQGLAQEAEQVKRLGFRGKLVIHPEQVAVVNRIFSPTAEEIAYAREVVAVFTKAETKGMAAIDLNGKFIDYPIAYQAQKLLDWAETITNLKGEH
jgi:citrate lyase subunit beta/citryl-CoA lyase